MSFTTRTPTFRPQLSVRRVYETIQPPSEMKETPEANLLHVYIPGFTKDKVKITYEDSSRTVKISGERQIQGNRWSRFDQSYPFPENSEAGALQGKFEATGILILIMPKKAGAGQAKPDEKGQETIPTQPTTTKLEQPIEEKKSVSPPSPRKDLADLHSQKATHEEISSQFPSESQIKDLGPQKAQQEAEGRSSPIETSKPQMGEKESKLKPTPTMTTKMQTDEKPQKGQEEVEPKPTPTMTTKMHTDEKPQKGQEEVEPKPTPTIATKLQTDEKPPKGQEEVEPKSTETVATKIQTDEKPPKSQEEIERKPTLTNITSKPTEDKLQEGIGLKATFSKVKSLLEEKKTKRTSAEDAEKERISKTEDHGMPSESRKPLKDKEKSSFKEETKTKKLSTKEAEPSTPKVHKKEENQEGKSKEDVMDTKGNIGIRKLVCAASQFVPNIAERNWNEDKKHFAANIGAAVLVVAALGAYVSYRFGS